MDINRKVESFLAKHKYEKRKTSFTIILSVLIAFCVISSLIMPAISMTIEETQNQMAAVEEVMLLGEGETPQPPADALNIAGMNFLVSVNSNASPDNLPIYSNYPGSNDHDGQLEVNRDSIDLSFDMQYSSSSVTLPPSGPHLYLDLTSLINVDPNVFLNSTSRTGDIIDGDWVSTEKAGTFVIEEDGYVKITLTNDYITNHVNTGDRSLKGSLHFSGELHRSNDDNGDQSFTIGGKEIQVNFPDKYATLQKGEPQIDTTKGVVNWTVTINKEHGSSLKDYNLTDTVFVESYFIEDSISYDPSNAGTYDGEKITFNDDDSIKNTSTITIHYQTKITSEQINDGNGSLSNQATLTKDNHSSSDNKTAWFTKKPISVDKTGTPDYQTSGGTYNNQIQWQIKITSEYGTTLNGCVIDDSKLPDSGWTISPEGATITKREDGKWTLSNVPDGTKDVTITYLAPIDSSTGTSQSNTAKVTPPGSDTPVEDTGTITYQQEKDLITPTKSGTYDADTHTITWTVNVEATDGYTLKGYELQDDKFTGTWTSSYCSYKRGHNKQLSEVADYNSVTHTLKVKDNVDVDFIRLEYTEVLTPAEFLGSTPVTTQVANELDIPKVSKTETAEVDVTYRNTLTKKCLNGEKESSESEESINKTLNWQADVTYDGKFADKEYVDVLIGDMEDGGTHTITEDQLNSIVVRAAAGDIKDWEQPLTKGTDYTVEQTETGFKIKFLSGFDSNNQYNHVRINYSTTAQATIDFNDEPGKTISYTFSNNATFNGNDSSGSYEIERTNPVGVKTTDLQVTKRWGTAQKASDRPTVRMTILGKVKNSNDDYAVVRKDASGNYLFKGDAGYDNATDVTVEIGGGQTDSGWLGVNATVKDLPIKETEKIDGNLVTTEYTYKVQETHYKDKNEKWQSIEGSYFEYGDGIYKIHSNNDYEVQNDYVADINLSFEKKWSENNLGITKVKVALYYRDENYQYVPVQKTSDGTYVFNGKDRYGKSVSGDLFGVEVELDSNGTEVPLDKLLPASIVVDNQVWNCNYTLREIGYCDTDNNWYNINPDVSDVDTKNGYFTISDPTSTDKSGTLTVTNNGTADIEITPQKKWEGDSKDNYGADNIQSITVALKRSKDDWASWEYYADENGQPKTITIISDGTSDRIWETTEKWTNLPVYEDKDGNKVTWRYQVVETHYTPVGGEETEITDNQFILNDKGYYDVSNSQNDIQSTNTYVVTNTFHDGGDMELKVTKNWWNNGSSAEISDRPTAIQVKIERMASNATGWMPYPDEANCTYTMTPSSSGTWELSLPNVPRQGKDDKGNLVTYIYRVTEVGYTANGQTHEIKENQFVTTTAGYYEITYGNTIDTSKSNSGDTLSITNSYHPAETTKIIPQKVWAEDGEHLENRPYAVHLQLQQRSQKADGTWNTWDAVEGYEQIEISGSTDTATWNGALIENLPTKEITLGEDGTVTITNYQYRLIETEYQEKVKQGDTYEGGDWKSLQVNENSSNFKLEFTSNTGATLGKYTITYGTSQDYEGKMAVTNTFKQDAGMEKNLVSENGEINPVFEVEDLTNAKSDDSAKQALSPIKCITIDGVKYYVFNWLIHYKSWRELGLKSGTELNKYLTPISDTLPEGHTLCVLDTQDENGNWRDVGTGSIKDIYGTEFPADNSGNNGTELLEPLSSQYYGGYFKHPTFIWPGYYALYAGRQTSASGCYHTGTNSSSQKYYYDTTTNTVYFNEPSMWDDMYIGYATKIKCDDLDAKIGETNYTFSNLVKKYTEEGDKSVPNGESTQLDVTIKQPSDLVQKSYQETLLPGVLQFSLHINPEGKNLSNGSTIDIEDIFKVTGYEDKCTVTSGTKNVTDPDGKLVDTLMSNIVLYEVDVSGNKTRLPSSEYSMQFENGDSVSNGSALLKLTIPDEKHIYIEYTYKMLANKDTPSVINGCWASQLVNGMRVKMQPGMVPPAGDIITFSNEARLEADSATGEDSTDNTQYQVSESGGTISTNRLPEIYKVNTGDYTINDLPATFYLAKYENGKWYYATRIDENRRLTWGETGFDGTRVDPSALEIDVQEAYQVVLGQNTLYKLVEISVPDGYAGSDLLNGNAAAFKEMLLGYMNRGETKYNGVDYSNFLTKYRHTNYFSYNSILSSYPEGITANQVMQIKSGDNIEIPNNELIDLSVSKQWIGSATEAEKDNSSVTLELYWSDKKTTTGLPPADAKLVEPAELGIQVPEGTTFSHTKTIPMAMLDGKSPIWTDLPNGLDSGTGNKPIYYYIKETAYTIGGKTYTLQDDGTFKTEVAENETPEEGTYLPIYVGNAANTNATITVKNTQKLMLQKEWKDANNNPLSENKIPDKILVSIYGIDGNGVQTSSPIFSNVELKKTENWTKDITALLGTNDLNSTLNYKSYIAKEVIPEGETAQLNNYVISCVFNLNANSGDITITNKSNVPSSTSVEIQKQWSDGTEIHAVEWEKNGKKITDSIHVSLWRSTEKIPDAELANLTTAVLQKYHAEQMVPPAGPAEEGQTLPVYEVDLSAANNWKYVWTGLEMEDESTTPAQKYYYYAYEDLSASNIQDGTNADTSSKYTPSYTIKSQTTGKTTYIVTNSRNSIVAKKVWYDENGNLEKNNMSNLPEVKLDVYKKEAKIPESGLNVLALGDSITNGDGNGSKGYLSYLVDDLKNNEIKVNSSEKKGYSGKAIRAMPDKIDYMESTGETRDGIWENIQNTDLSKYDTICLMAGTNDLISNYVNNIDGRLEWLIKNLYSDSLEGYSNFKGNSKAVIFVASIPYFGTTGTESGTICSWFSSSKGWDRNTYQSPSDFENYINNTVIKGYNQRIKELVEKLKEEGYKIEFVDINSVVDSWSDGCHPDDASNVKMAAKWAEAINDYYSSSSAPIGKITLNKDNNWMGSCDIVGGSASDEYYVVETKVPTGWTKEITDAAGNIIPNDGPSNSQKAGSGTPITIANKRSIPKTELFVEKTWVGDDAKADATNRAKISLILQQSTDRETWVDTTIAMPTKTVDPMDGNKWIYTYTDLPTQDINGNQYYYKIREEALEGYTTAYGETDGLAAVAGNTGTLHVTNTRGISLTVKKVWMDENGEALTEGLPTAITVRIHRSTSLESVPDNVKENLILQVPATASVGVGKEVTVTANKNVTEVTSSNPEIATVTYDGNQITITGVAEGPATITVTDGKTTEEITVTVSALEIYLNSAQPPFTMVAGEIGTLTAKKGSDTVSAEFTITEGASLVTLNGSQVTANAAGEVTVKATTEDGMETTATIIISLPETFEISGPSEVAIGDTIQLDVVDKYGATFTWSSSNSDVASVDLNTGLVTGKTVGKTVITAKRGDNVEVTYEVTVLDASIELNGSSTTIPFDDGKTSSDISSIKIIVENIDYSSNPYYYGMTIKLLPHLDNTGWDAEQLTFDSKLLQDSSKSCTLTFDSSAWSRTDHMGIYIEAYGGLKCKVTVIINYKTTLRSASLDAPLQLGEASVAAEEIMPMLGAADDATNTSVDFKNNVATITLSPTSSSEGEPWTYVAKNLDVYDANGHSYYYWVEEVNAGEGELSNYEVSYLFDDADGDTTYAINAANPGNNATATIRNTKTQNESYELPSTGGIGTRWYTIAGLLVLGGGCGGFATTHLIRRFRRRKCTK